MSVGRVWESFVDFWELVCALCRKICCEFVGKSVCCVWDRLFWVCGNECALCRTFVVGFWE